MPPPNKAEGGSPIFGFTIGVDEIIDLFDKPGKRPSEAALEFEQRVFEQSVQSSLPPTTSAGKVGVIIRLIVLGEKLVKLVFGTSEDAGSNSSFALLDDLIKGDHPDKKARLFDLVRRSRAKFGQAGITLLDPVWLADPAVGG